MRRLLILSATLIAAWCSSPAFAHKASDAYLQLVQQGDRTTLRVDVALRDLDVALDLDADANGELTWGEIRGAQARIDGYVSSRVGLADCSLGIVERGLERRNDGAYAAITFAGDCAAAPVIEYRLLADLDPNHRGIARIARDRTAPQLLVLDPNAALGAVPQRAATVGAETAAQVPGSLFAEGIHHIVTGYDHVLFLLCLILPAVMRRTREGWRPVDRLGQAVWPVAVVVTAFTVAHSITLALATLDVASLPPGLIEPAIAATIVLAALDNLRPIFGARRGLVTFCFGLVHGFGFAGVLGELNLPPGEFAWALLRFNVGLEVGQLAIVVVASALLYALRHVQAYPTWVIRGGSLAAMVVGVLWFVERTTQVSLLPV